MARGTDEATGQPTVLVKWRGLDYDKASTFFVLICLRFPPRSHGAFSNTCLSCGSRRGLDYDEASCAWLGLVVCWPVM